MRNQFQVSWKEVLNQLPIAEGMPISEISASVTSMYYAGTTNSLYNDRSQNEEEKSGFGRGSSSRGSEPFQTVQPEEPLSSAIGFVTKVHAYERHEF